MLFRSIEILVVLAVLGLATGLVLARGPARSAGLDARAAAVEVADMLRQARAQAIAGNRVVRVIVDSSGRRVAAADGTMRGVSLSAGTVVNLAGATRDDLAAITFAPDGSSTGGQIDLTVSGRRARVAVSWLTGRVSVGDAP